MTNPSDNPQVDLSISIVTYNSDLTLLKESLRRLERSTKRAIADGVLQKAKVTIIDNGDDAATIDMVMNECLADTESTLIANPTNIGYGPAHNMAIEATRADFHLVLNPDVYLAPSAVSVAVRYLQGCDEASMVTPRGQNEAGSPLYLSKRYPSVLILLMRGFAPGWLKNLTNIQANYEMHDLTDSKPSTVPLASGCCMLCRAQVLKQVRGFSPDYFLYFEDFDLCRRLSSIGAITYLPDMMVVHHGGNAARKGFQHILYFLTSAFRFFQSHGWKWY